MNKLQAALRDKAAKGWRERKLYYRVGSVFKGCAHCGELDPEYERPRYLSGHQVFRAYDPKWMGWTYKCWDCGSIDGECWAGAWDIGMEPIVGARDVVREIKMSIRKDLQQREKQEVRIDQVKAAKIRSLEEQLAELEKLVKEME